MSSAKPDKMSVERQVKAGLRAVRDFLAGRSSDAGVAETEDKVTRDLVAAELVAKMSGRPIGEPTGAAEDNSDQKPGGETNQEDKGASELSKQEEYSQNPNGEEQERERARTLFLEHGYFDEVVETLRTGSSPAERADAARTLGLVGNQRGTAHLVAALFDDHPEVRNAAEEAISHINGPTEAVDAVPFVIHHQPTVTGEDDSTQAVMGQAEGVDSGEVSEATEIASITPSITPSSGQTEPRLEQAPESGSGPELAALNLTAADSVPTVEEEQLLLEEHRIRESVEQVTRQLLETVAEFKQREQEVHARTEREAHLRAEAAIRRSEEEALRKQADEEAERLRAEERETLTAERTARAKTETEAQQLAEDEIRLRLQAADLRLTIAELARQRAASETARREAAEAARQAEAKRARDEAKERHEAELARLHSEEEALRNTTDEIALRRANVEIEREKADAEAQRLVEAHARMQAAAEAGAQAEIERSHLEAEINDRTETARRRLEETRRREEEEYERLQEETRRHSEEQQRRLEESQLLRTRAEAESKQLAEKQQQIVNQVNSLRFADAETRKRIAAAEASKRAAEDAYHLLAEKVQRVEAEAHARAKEEEQMLAKLEAERRTVAVEAQSRAAQEKRIREEIEMFRRLEEQERPRLEAATLQRTEAETRLRQLRERLKAEVETRLTVEKELKVSEQYKVLAAGQSASIGGYEHRNETRSQTAASAAGESPTSFTQGFAAFDTRARASDNAESADDADGRTGSTATPSIVAYLNSVDPYKRAAAVAELARGRSEDAFRLISNCFDDASAHVRNAAARAFRKLEPNRTVDLFNRALEEASVERRRNIGAAIAASGLASEAINNLVGENREETYNALSILFVMAKTGEVEPLVRALENHPNDEIGKAVRKLLNLSGHPVQ